MCGKGDILTYRDYITCIDYRCPRAVVHNQVDCMLVSYVNVIKNGQMNGRTDCSTCTKNLKASLLVLIDETENCVLCDSNFHMSKSTV